MEKVEREENAEILKREKSSIVDFCEILMEISVQCFRFFSVSVFLTGSRTDSELIDQLIMIRLCGLKLLELTLQISRFRERACERCIHQD